MSRSHPPERVGKAREKASIALEELLRAGRLKEHTMRAAAELCLAILDKMLSNEEAHYFVDHIALQYKRTQRLVSETREMHGHLCKSCPHPCCYAHYAGILDMVAVALPKALNAYPDRLSVEDVLEWLPAPNLDPQGNIDTGKCPFLRESGCAFPPLQRPLVCAGYFCHKWYDAHNQSVFEEDVGRANRLLVRALDYAIADITVLLKEWSGITTNFALPVHSDSNRWWEGR